MNIRIDSEDSFKKEMTSVINNLSERMSFIEDVILSKDEDQIDDLDNENNEDCCCEDCCCEDKRDYSLDEHLLSDLITSMKRLREYDLQKYKEYYEYLEDDDDIISDLNSTYYAE